MFTHRLSAHAELRPLELRYVQELYDLAMANRDRLRPWFPWISDEMKVDDTRKYIEGAVAAAGRGESFQACLFVQGKLAGTADLHGVNAMNKRAEIGYWLAAEAEGKGYMTQTVTALLNHGFGPMALHRIDILADPTNARSRTVPERLGLELEGIRREYAWVHGKCCDLACYTITAPRWHSRTA